jgi:hypothetical protein
MGDSKIATQMESSSALLATHLEQIKCNKKEEKNEVHLDLDLAEAVLMTCKELFYTLKPGDSVLFQVKLNEGLWVEKVIRRIVISTTLGAARIWFTGEPYALINTWNNYTDMRAKNFDSIRWIPLLGSLEETTTILSKICRNKLLLVLNKEEISA